MKSIILMGARVPVRNNIISDEVNNIINEEVKININKKCGVNINISNEAYMVIKERARIDGVTPGCIVERLASMVSLRD